MYNTLKINNSNNKKAYGENFMHITIRDDDENLWNFLIVCMFVCMYECIHDQKNNPEGTKTYGTVYLW